MKFSLKKSCFLVVAAGFLVALVSSCEEVPPSINLNPPPVAGLLDTTFINSTPAAPQAKVVLMEEFTGLTCPNCPAGHVELDNIIAANPGQVAAISIVNYFSDPHPMAMQDYQITEGGDIATLLGSVVAWPAASVDRVVHTGQSSIISTSLMQWSTFVTTQLATTPQVNISMSNAFVPSSRELLITMDLEFTSAVTGSHAYSIDLVESSIIDVQDNSMGTNPAYNHKHLLREMVTNANGETITASTVAGRVIQKQFSYTIPMGWDETNMEVVIFVHESGSNKAVLQAAIDNVL